MKNKNLLASAVLWTAIATSPNVQANSVDVGANYSNDKVTPALAVSIDNNKAAVKTILDPKHQAIVAGKAIDNGYAIVGASLANESKNGTSLKGHSVFGEAAITNPAENIRFVRAWVTHKRVSSANLWTSSSVSTDQVVDITDDIKTTTTTTTINTKSSSLKWGKSTSVKLDTGIKAWQNWTIIAWVSHTTGDLNKANRSNKVAWHLGYEYLADNGTRTSVEYDTNHNVRTTLNVQAGKNTSVYAWASANVKHGNDKTALVWVKYTWGWSKSQSTPSTPNLDKYSAQNQMLNRVNGFDLTSDQIINNLHDKVKKSTTEKIAQIVDIQTERTNKPQPQPQPQPNKPTFSIPDNAPVEPTLPEYTDPIGINPDHAPIEPELPEYTDPIWVNPDNAPVEPALPEYNEALATNPDHAPVEPELPELKYKVEETVKESNVIPHETEEIWTYKLPRWTREIIQKWVDGKVIERTKKVITEDGREFEETETETINPEKEIVKKSLISPYTELSYKAIKDYLEKNNYTFDTKKSYIIDDITNTYIEDTYPNYEDYEKSENYDRKDLFLLIDPKTKAIVWHTETEDDRFRITLMGTYSDGEYLMQPAQEMPENEYPDKDHLYLWKFDEPFKVKIVNYKHYSVNFNRSYLNRIKFLDK